LEGKTPLEMIASDRSGLIEVGNRHDPIRIQANLAPGVLERPLRRSQDGEHLWPVRILVRRFEELAGALYLLLEFLEPVEVPSVHSCNVGPGSRVSNNLQDSERTPGSLQRFTIDHFEISSLKWDRMSRSAVQQRELGDAE
jgi:hypothetical protein